jgi:IMP_dehydrog: inosine-5'-monophosphate dehydrogenase
MSFINERVQPEGLTFDDVLLIPAYSEVLPREVNVQTRFFAKYQTQHPHCVRCHGHRYEAPLAMRWP